MATAIASTGFSQEAFDAFLAARDEPAWLIDMRRKAWQRFQELPMPSVRDEEWMRTDIRLFKLDRFNLPEPDGHRAAAQIAVPHALLAAGVELGGHAVSMNSHGVAAELDPKLATQGVLVRQPGAARPRAWRSVAAIFRTPRRRSVSRTNSPRSTRPAGRAARCCTCRRMCGSICRCIRFRRLATAASILAKRW